MNAKVDEIDRPILSLLHKGAWASFSNVARKLNISEETAHVRVKIEKVGTIKKHRSRIPRETLEDGLTAFASVKASPTLQQRFKTLTKIKGLFKVHDFARENYANLKVRTQDTCRSSRIIGKIGTIDGAVSTKTIF
jgi:DNA-binding Lrp family transcriptional regulator